MNFAATILKWIEAHPAAGPVLLTAAFTMGGTVIFGLFKWLRSTLKNSSPYMKPTFYSFGASYSVVAVHEFLPSPSPSGYHQIQHSRPDQWHKLISIKTSFFGLRHQVIPSDPLAHLVVLLRPTDNSGEKHIRFNR